MHRERLVVYPHAGTLVGGSTHSSLLMSEFLQKYGWRIVHVFPGHGPGLEVTKARGAETHDQGFSSEDILTLRNTGGIHRKLRALIPQVKSYWAAREWLTEHQPQLVHLNDDRSVLTWGFAAKRLGIPVVWHVRQNSGNELLDRFRLPLANRLIYIAENTKLRFENQRTVPPGNVIYNALDTARFRPAENKIERRCELGLPVHGIAIGYVGNFVARKRPEWLIAVVAELAKQGLDVYGVVVGTDLSAGDYTRKLLKLIDDTNVAERFRFIGYREDIERVMQGLDILVLPSVNEPFGRVVIEAMACELAVVATCAGGVVEVVQDGQTGILVSPAGPVGMIESVRALCENPEQRKSIAKKARVYAARRFSPEATLQSVAEVYSTLAC
jgi:glycosyltransferase involved in cell wall biosynthesis